MKRTALFITLILAFIGVSNAQIERIEKGNLVIEGVPEIPQSVSERYQQYLNTRSADFSGWASDRKGMYISTRFGETSQIHYVEEPGGNRKQITFFDEPVGNIAVRPTKGKSEFLMMKDVGGNEVNQIFHFDVEQASYTQLSDGKSRYGNVFWSQDGRYYAYNSNERNPTQFDIYLAKADSEEAPKMVYQGDGYWLPIDISEYNDKILIYNYVSVNESKLQVLDLESNKITPIQLSKEKISFGAAAFSHDGNGVYFASDFESEFTHMQYYDLTSGNIFNIGLNLGWDVEFISVDYTGKWVIYSMNVNGMSNLYAMDLTHGTVKEVKNIPTGVISGGEFSHDGNNFAFTVNSYITPGDVYVVNMETMMPTRWTFSEVGGLNTGTFIKPELIEYETFDKIDGKSRRIPAYYYKPKGDGPFPVIIVFHGGPEAQYRPRFSTTYQYWLNELGFAVIAPNVRGSSGYGKSYLKLDNGFKRKDAVKDGGALLDWIAEQPELDKSKVGVFGGSYGGYMVLAMMVDYNDRLACGIDIVGISNFVTFLKNTGEYRRDLRRVEYGEERDPKMSEFLEKISPTNNSDKISIPLFVVQGLNDPRVPASEAEQMVNEIRKNKGDVWYLMAKDEGHGFRKKTNRDYFYKSVALFFEKYLK